MILLVLVAAAVAFAWYSHMKRRHGHGVLLWRLLSGHALDGRYRTDASWLHWSTVTSHPTRVVRWHHMPRLYRAAIRDGLVVAVVVLAVDLARHRTGLLEVLAAAALLLAAAGCWWAYRRLRHFRHHYRYHRPLMHTLTRELEAPPRRLEIAADRSKITVGLPEDCNPTGKEREAITRAVVDRLGIEAPEDDWQLQGKRPRVVYRKSEPPPAKVTARTILPAVRDAAEHEVILGIGKKDAVIGVSLDSESPHLGYCMTTGDGKSMAAMNVSTQVLWHGGLVVILDYKLMSHMWARGLPNVAYAGTPPELHAMLCWLANDDDAESELTRRKKVALASADIRGNVRADLGPRILIAAEELNVTQKILKAWWRKIGGKGPSPAAEALDEVMFTGRQLRVHALQIGQRLSAKATSGGGSADSRENIGAIMFSNPSASTWKMLCDGHAQPPASDHKGRYQLVTRKEVRELQGALWDEQEARDFATAGTIAVPRHDMPFVWRPAAVPAVVGHSDPRAMEGSDQGFVVQQEALPPARDPGCYTLQEAVAAGMWPSIHAARQARQRHKPPPQGRIGSADLYRIEDLEACKVRGRR